MSEKLNYALDATKKAADEAGMSDKFYRDEPANKYGVAETLGRGLMSPNKIWVGPNHLSAETETGKTFYKTETVPGGHETTIRRPGYEHVSHDSRIAEQVGVVTAHAIRNEIQREVAKSEQKVA